MRKGALETFDRTIFLDILSNTQVSLSVPQTKCLHLIILSSGAQSAVFRSLSTIAFAMRCNCAKSYLPLWEET